MHKDLSKFSLMTYNMLYVMLTCQLRGQNCCLCLLFHSARAMGSNPAPFTGKTLSMRKEAENHFMKILCPKDLISLPTGNFLRQSLFRELTRPARSQRCFTDFQGFFVCVGLSTCCFAYSISSVAETRDRDLSSF